ncbi:MAG: hypothetical protein JNM02_14945, partial [Anaerolineales bacterium]|nr:hypothetical protein [Anaerolineales bacterium]
MKYSMSRAAKTTASILVILLLAIAAGLLWKTRSEAYSLLHSPMATRELPDETPADYALEFEDVTVTNPAGMKLAGWFIPSENGAV